MERPRFKIILKAIIIIIISAIALIIFSIVIWYKTLPENEIRVHNSHYSSDHFDNDGAFYYSGHNGFYKKTEPNVEDELIIDINMEEKTAIFSYADKKIYICEKSDSGKVITPYDLSGNPDGEPVVLPYDDLSILKIENGLVTALNSDDELIRFDINEPSKYSTIDKLEYEDSDIYYLGDNDNTYVSNLRFGDYIGRIGKIIYYYPAYDRQEINVINLEDNSKSVYDLDEYCYGWFTFATFNGDVITIASISASQFFIHTLSVPPIDQELKHHDYDTCYKIDPDTLEVLDTHKFRKYERIIYADDKKVLTFYKGKLITYSADSWEQISSEKRYNKKHSYSFSIYDEHIFVYDDTTGEMIDKISVKDE